MNRRELLKFSLLAPIAGLFKKKEPEGLKVAQLKGLSQTDICNEALTCISETTGVSNEGAISIDFSSTFLYEFYCSDGNWASHIPKLGWTIKSIEVKGNRFHLYGYD